MVLKLSLAQKSIGSGLLFVLALFCVANHHLEWGFFGRFSKHAIAAVFILIFIYQLRIGPTLKEMLDHRDQKSGASAPAPLRPWLYILTISVTMLVFALIEPVLRLAKGQSLQQRDWIVFISTEVLVVVAGVIGWRHLKRIQNLRANRR